jgi:membrane protease YdiL (CAAX protease family)
MLTLLAWLASFQYWFFVAAALALVAFMAYATYRSARLLDHWPAEINPLFHPAENAFRLLLILLCFGLGWMSTLPPAQLGWRPPATTVELILGIGGGLLLALIYYLGTRWVMARTGHRYYSPKLIRLIVPRNRREFAATLVVMLAVVLVEELIFRSLLIGGLTPLAAPWVLVVASSAIFGLMHSPQGAWGMLGVSLGGLLLGWMFVASGSLAMPLVCHYVANVVQIAAAYRLQRLGLL